MERFTEQIVAKQKRALNEVLYYLSWILIVVLGLASLLNVNIMLNLQFDIPSLILTVLMIGCAVWMYLYKNRLRAEYEYTFTNGDLDFAMVFNNIKRKPLGSLKVRNVEAFGAVNSGSFQRYITMPDVKKLNWFLNREAELYYFFFQKEGKKSILVFEPNAEMVDYIKQYLPQGALQKN